MDIPEIADARRLRFRPGDVLAVRFDHSLDDEEIDHLHGAVTGAFGPDVKVLVLEPGVEIGIIGPADAEAATASPSGLTMEFDSSAGDEQFLRWLRDAIRRRGGSAQTVLGS